MRSRWYRCVRAALLTAVSALFLAAPVAQAADPVPALPSDRVAVAPGVEGNFTQLRRAVSSTSRVDAQYAVCIVRFSDPRNRRRKNPASTVAYVDDVFDAWKSGLDAERHILIAVSTENRGIAIHPGSTWAGLGFEKAAITRVIDGSSFATMARAGDIPRGIEQLIGAVDLHLSIQVANAERQAKSVGADLSRLTQQIAAFKSGGSRTFDTRDVDAPTREADDFARQAAAQLEAGNVGSARTLVERGNLSLRLANRTLASLDAKQREIEELRRSAPEDIRTARDGLVAVVERLRAAPYDAASLLEDAAGVGESLDEAERTLAAGDPVKAARQARNAKRWIEQLRRGEAEAHNAHRHHVEQLALARRRLSELATSIAERERQLADVPFEVGDLRRALDGVGEAHQQSETAIASGNVQSALKLLSRTELRLVRFDADFVAAEGAHHFQTVVLPRAAGGGAGAFLLLLFLVHWMTRRSRRGTATRRIERWQRMLERGGTRLVKLRDDHPHLFGSRRLHRRYTGESARIYQEVGTQVDDLFLTYGNATEQLKLARATLAAAPLLGWKAYDRAAGLLEDADVEVRREAVDDRQLFLPETRVITRRADDLLEHLAEVYESVYEAVDDLERRVLVAPQTLEQIGDLGAECEQALTVITQAGFYPDALRKELAAFTENEDRVTDAAESDPIGAHANAMELLGLGTVLRERLARTEEAATLITEAVGTHLTATQGELERLRREEGLRLEEPGFEPSAMIHLVRTAADEVSRHIGGGADADALSAARRADAALRELDDLIARTIRSRDETPGQLDGLRDEERRLRDRLPERRNRLATLARSHAEDALQPAFDNAEEALAALDFCVRCVDEAQAAVSPSAQRYLGGAEIAHRALEVLRAVADLFEEIETKADELDAARRAAQEALAAARTLSLDLDQLIAQAEFASAAVLEEVRGVTEGIALVAGQFDEDPPNWLLGRDAADDLRNVAQGTLDRARQEHTAFVAAMAMQVDVEQSFHRVDRLLAGSEVDRAPANRRLVDARELLSESVTARAQEHPDWTVVLTLLEDVKEAVVEAEALAIDDFAAAAAAQAEISAAERAVARASRRYGRGVRALLGDERRGLADAKRKMSAREYEAAYADAGTARSNADRARRVAQRKVRALEEADAAAAMMALRAHRARRSRRSRSSMFGGFSSSSGSSFGSSSGGSSFGGSSSGGSSFGGSSSGGSGW